MPTPPPPMIRTLILDIVFLGFVIVMVMGRTEVCSFDDEGVIYEENNRQSRNPRSER